MNLVGRKRKRRHNGGCKIQEIEVGVGASQAINYNIVSVGQLGHFVGVEPYLFSGFVLWDHHCRVGEGLSDLQGMQTSNLSMQTSKPDVQGSHADKQARCWFIHNVSNFKDSCHHVNY
jgi:hypothetical protein